MGTKKKKSPIKQESSFTGSITEHKDGSVFAFIDIKNKEGSIANSIELSKIEVNGLKKFFTFLAIGQYS